MLELCEFILFCILGWIWCLSYLVNTRTPKQPTEIVIHHIYENEHVENESIKVDRLPPELQELILENVNIPDDTFEKYMTRKTTEKRDPRKGHEET